MLLDEQVELFLEAVEVPEPGPGEVVVRVEASPINPSDIGLLLGGADVSAAVSSGLPTGPSSPRRFLTPPCAP